MDKKLLILLTITGLLALIIGYSAHLSDWMHDYSDNSGRYERLKNAAMLVALGVYTYFGIRFFKRHVAERV